VLLARDIPDRGLEREALAERVPRCELLARRAVVDDEQHVRVGDVERPRDPHVEAAQLEPPRARGGLRGDQEVVLALRPLRVDVALVAVLEHDFRGHIDSIRASIPMTHRAEIGGQRRWRAFAKGC
jgi:hypothetical protein